MAAGPDRYTMVSLLDDLRVAYELARESGHPELQARLMDARRGLLALLHQYFDLQREVIDLQDDSSDRTERASDVSLYDAFLRGDRKGGSSRFS